MPFIPHTESDIAAMLDVIGIDKIETLFDEIPDSLRRVSLEAIPEGVSEMELSQLMRERAELDGQLLCFLGAGSYEHHIPAAVWEIAGRGEFMTAYTPYQAEASQGSLQLIYEYQTMMASLMGMEVSNASLYDGASGLAEAILMAARIANKKASTTILMPRTIHPHYRDTAKTITSAQSIQFVEVPYVAKTGQIDFSSLDTLLSAETAALVIPQPNFFGVLEDVDALTDWARQKGLLSIAVVNPMAMALFKPPGEWGEAGVDIVCGEGQPLGIPMASGGPYYGFLCCQQKHVRQMPGRIVGRTVDLNGQEGFVLTLQAREQHIRRGKATSNICTNQGLMVTASTIYMSLMGPEGLKRIAALCHTRARELQQALIHIDGIQSVFPTPYFNEIVLRLTVPAEPVLHALAERGIQGGLALHPYYPELENCILVCATETKTKTMIQTFARALSEVLVGSKNTCLT